jgi:hypothetical protein
MQVNIEQLIADLARKINACELTPHSRPLFNFHKSWIGRMLPA